MSTQRLLPWLPAWVTVIIVGMVVPAGGAAERPHIVLLYADDLGYGDVQCYNPQRGKIPTPHIDRLAREGMRFTDAHSSSGVCSPSRYTLLTGRYHWRTRLQKGIVGLWGSPLIDAQRPTLATLLADHGYRTACVGKWHLGWDWPIDPGDKPLFRGDKRGTASDSQQQAWHKCFAQRIPGGPIARGFQSYFGTDVPNWPPFCFIEQDRTVGIPSELLPAPMFENHLASVQGPALPGWKLEPILPALAERAVALIQEAARDEQPLFLYLPLTSPHTPLAVNDAFQGSTGLGPYADLVVETDAVVGQVLEALDRTGLADTTMVWFTSDNGCAPYIGVEELERRGHCPSGPWRGYKSDVWEGGHRVPLVVRWPGHVRAQAVASQLVHQADVFATLAALVESDVPATAAEDSISLLPVLAGSTQAVRHEAVSQSMRGLFSYRQGNWKLIFGPGSGGWSESTATHPVQLYDLASDPGEQQNVAAEQIELVTQLTKQMQSLVDRGRSTPGPQQANDVPVRWRPASP